MHNMMLIKQLKNFIKPNDDDFQSVTITYSNLNCIYRKDLYFMFRGTLKIDGLHTDTVLKIDYFNQRGFYGEPHYLDPFTYTQNGEYELFFKIPLDRSSNSTICTDISVYKKSNDGETLIAFTECDFDYTKTQVIKTIDSSTTDFMYCDTTVTLEDGTELTGENSPVKVRATGNDSEVTQLLNNAIANVSNAKEFINYVSGNDSEADNFSDVDFFEECTEFKVFQVDVISDNYYSNSGIIEEGGSSAYIVFNILKNLLGDYSNDNYGRVFTVIPMQIDISCSDVTENCSFLGEITALTVDDITEAEENTVNIAASGIDVLRACEHTGKDDMKMILVIASYQ